MYKFLPVPAYMYLIQFLNVAKVDGSSFRCSECQLPMCGEDACAKSQIHRNAECAIFRDKSVNIETPVSNKTQVLWTNIVKNSHN